jgi:hypothetical protein
MLNFLEFFYACTPPALSRLYLRTAMQNHLHLPPPYAGGIRQRRHGDAQGKVYAPVLDKAW